MDIRFTKHAYIRTTERSILKPSTICNIIKKGQYVLIGKDKDKKHLLIYSIADKTYYVIIMDDKTKEIVTFLHPDYHDNISWTISEEAYKEAKEFYIQNEDEPSIPDRTLNNYRIKILKSIDGKPKNIKIGTFCANIHEDYLEYTDDFWNYVYNKVSENEYKDIEKLIINWGSNKNPSFKIIDYKEKDE